MDITRLSLPHSSADAPMEEQALYRQFTETKQEPLRLSAALKGFFLEAEIEQTHREAYGAYLRRRIRPAVEALIEQEDTDKLATLEALGWLDRRLTDEFLRTARARRKPAAMVWLLQMKQEKYGFQDRDFSL